MPGKAVDQVVGDDPNTSYKLYLKSNKKVGHRVNGVPSRFELFLLGDGEKKVETREETSAPNTTLFTFNKEDHTLGNLLTQRLHKYPHVTFSAYKVPHPLFATFELRVSTDGSVTPKEAVITACKDIVNELEVLNRSFATEWLGKRIVSEGEQERMARERDNYQ
ncbi:DNA-directed RNA polymerase [Dendryphion nanum]|uniref:DNA-directed RNA polymerase n=1 Tax=Dendryphion nanum TaxID=256645 RepID=A0A9P9E7S9_9PLEO|nr:DNA-directed RNA polymerase [Dendryphion nanum]